MSEEVKNMNETKPETATKETAAPVETMADYEDAINASLKPIHEGDILTGEVIGMTSFFGDSHYFSIPIAQVLQVPQKLSLPLSAMQGYTYTPSAPQNLRARLAQDGYAYVSWAPVYGADHYYVYKSLTPDGPYTRISNNSSEKWYWGYPQCFGISVNGTCYLRVTTVIDGQESAPSESIKITK